MEAYNSKITVVLLKLVRLALGKGTDNAIPIDVLWEKVLELADAQGVTAIVSDGFSKMDIQIPLDIKMRFVSRVVTYEQLYQHQEELMVKLAKMYRNGGFKMMVLNGWGLSLDYPVPSHRPSAGLDIWNFGQWKDADAYIVSCGVNIDNSHYNHSVFCVENMMVENHYDFINVYAFYSSRRIEKKLKELANREYWQKKVDGVEVYTPAATFNALFLLCLNAQHFAGSKMTLCQLLDWALFMEQHHTEVNWNEYIAFLKKERLWRFFNLLNLIAVEKLGFNRNIVPYDIEDDVMLERVFGDVISPKFGVLVDGTALSIMLRKLCRWWKNRWKYQLYFPDSFFSTHIFGGKHAEAKAFF